MGGVAKKLPVGIDSLDTWILKSELNALFEEHLHQLGDPPLEDLDTDRLNALKGSARIIAHVLLEKRKGLQYKFE